MIDIDFDRAEQIKSSFGELATEANEILSSLKNIDASIFSSYSPSTVANNNAVVEAVNSVYEQINDYGTSYSTSIDLYKEAYEQTKIEMSNPNGKESINESSMFSDSLHNELRATVDFIFAYPRASVNMKRISDSKLSDLLTKNGAKNVGSNIYELNIDGKTYRYNVSTHEITIPSGNGSKEGRLYCTFMAQDGVDFNTITSTLTLLAGSGERNDPTKEAAFGSGKLGANSSAILAIPYLSGSTYEHPYKIGGATRIADFMIGGKSRNNITNSIVGYSLGGMGAYATVSANKGLYQNMAIVNGGPKNVEKFGSYGNFKNVNIYMFEGSGDNFVDSNISFIKIMKSKGYNTNNIHVYTTDSRLYQYANKYGAYCEDIKKMSAFAKDRNHKGWSGHSHGYRMLEDSGIYSYLSRL